MTKSALVFALLLSARCLANEAPCIGSASVSGVAIPQEKLNLRKAAFEELCKKSQTPLVDAADETLQGRLVLPERPDPPRINAGTTPLKPQPASGKTTVVFIVEETGKVSWLSILDSSGDAQIDNSTATYFSRVIRYKKPGLLDGKPVRTFMTVQASILSRTVTVTGP
jgi:Gram-negative bacterial TonB protein C-terminal